MHSAVVSFDVEAVPPPFTGAVPSVMDSEARDAVFTSWIKFIEDIIACGGISDIMISNWGRCVARRNGQLAVATLPPALHGEDPFAVFAGHLFSSADNSDSGSQEALISIGGQRLRAVEIRCDQGTAGGREMTLRVIAQNIPSLADVCFPEAIVDRFLANSSGLVMLAGATGSGKSTSIAAMLQEAARRRALRVISIEDPIEYRFQDTPIGSIFTQRQLGRDCPDYVSALKRALRMNPDVLFVGEIRDPAVAEMVIEAACTGHRVLTTMHGGDPVTALRRLLSMATSAGMPSPHDSLADCFEACVAQKLISFGCEHPRVAIHEILTRTSGVVAKLRQDLVTTLRSDLETGRHAGMITYKLSLALKPRPAVEAPMSPPDLVFERRLPVSDLAQKELFLRLDSIRVFPHAPAECMEVVAPISVVVSPNPQQPGGKIWRRLVADWTQLFAARIRFEQAGLIRQHPLRTLLGERSLDGDLTEDEIALVACEELKRRALMLGADLLVQFSVRFEFVPDGVQPQRGAVPLVITSALAGMTAGAAEARRARAWRQQPEAVAVPAPGHDSVRAAGLEALAADLAERERQLEERETFLMDAEARLMQKIEEQQVREVELDHLEDTLRAARSSASPAR